MPENKKNVFTELHKNVKKRGKGLKNPPTKKTNSNVSIKEHTQAVPVKKRREYRISTYIHADAGNILEDKIQEIRKKTGFKPKIAQVLELALKSL